MGAETHVVVMAKHPVPGRVKTRLAAGLGAENACALYRAFVVDLAERLAHLPYAVTWAYWPPDAPFDRLVAGAPCRPQVGRDLGDRMAAAVEAVLREGARRVLVIGADAPHLPATGLDEAARALAGGADVVLGPAPDGGYYLIGLRAPAPTLFQGMPWGTAGVFAITRARASSARLKVHVLPPVFDIDDVRDLARLRALLARGGVILPRTAAVLARLGP